MNGRGPNVLHDPAQFLHDPHMTRSHRLIHRLIWPLLAVAVLLGVGMALQLRPPPDPPAPATMPAK